LERRKIKDPRGYPVERMTMHILKSLRVVLEEVTVSLQEDR
jgi:hypothetical protein